MLNPPVIKVIAGNQRATIEWDDVPGATGYNLYWGPRSDINTFNMFEMKVPLVSSPFVQTQLGDGITYYFIVQAISNKGSSYASNTASAVPAKPSPIVIRPFGDSITFGIGFADNTYCPVYAPGQKKCPDPPVGWGGGYRGWMTLISVKDQNIIFTTEGQQNGGSSLLQKQNSCQSHDGYPGYTTSQMISKSTMPSTAGVTLVHAGTNDIYWGWVIDHFHHTGFTVGPSAETLFQVVDNLLTTNTKTHVYVAKIIRFFAGTLVHPDAVGPLNTLVEEYNGLIDKKWSALPEAKKSRVTVVDMYSMLTTAGDYVDGVHPGREGYVKMACTWIRAINGVSPNVKDPCDGIATSAITRQMPQGPT